MKKPSLFDLVVWAILMVAIVAVGAIAAKAQPAISGNSSCSIDPVTGEQVCTMADGKTYRYPSHSNGTGAPSTYRQNSTSEVGIKFTCAQGDEAVPRQSPACDAGGWRRWAEEITKGVRQLEQSKQDRGQYLPAAALNDYVKKTDLPPPAKDGATTGYIEQRLQQLGKVVDDRLAADKKNAEQLAAHALAAAKEDAAKLLPGVLEAAKADVEKRIGELAPGLLSTITTDIDARLQNVVTTGAVTTVAGFGLKHLLLAAGAGGAGVLPAWLLVKLLGWGFKKLTSGNAARGSGGPRDGGFHFVG